MPYNDRLYQLLNDLDDSELEDLWVYGLQCKPDDPLLPRTGDNAAALVSIQECPGCDQ
ncbi:hypothetical protein [Ideonella oryzae]|uniref:hypothetical protein n=1 Tax=Ideonella oryzae TaxID=2937441 RepID=UPI002090319D|nr:hypothetical protein [Ideonella oryzae]